MLPLSLFDSAKRASGLALILFVVLHVGLKAVFFSAAYLTHVAGPIEAATRGAISPVLLSGLIQTALLCGVAMFALGGLRPADVGLRAKDLLNALIFTLLVWGSVQAAHSALAAFSVFEPSLNPNLLFGWEWASGRVLETMVGSALVEEITYRGFLVPQLYLLARLYTQDVRKQAAVALVLPQLYFGLHHVPAALNMGLPAGEAAAYLVHVVLVGFLFTALYLRTGNLFIAVVAHALVNNPMLVVVAGPHASLFALVAVCVLLLAWPTLNRYFEEVFTMPEPRLQPVPVE